MQTEEAIQQADCQVEGLLAEHKLVNNLDQPVNKHQAFVGIHLWLCVVQVEVVGLRLGL
jgi:hypothetical protein